MKITYTLTENDYIQYNLFHYKTHKTMNRQFMNIGVLVPLIIIFLGFMATRRINIFLLVVALAFAIFWFLFRGQILKRLVTKSIKNLMKEGKFNEFIGTKTLTILDDKIRLVDQYSTHEYFYSAVRSIQYDLEHLFIYVGTVSAIIVPFSAFESDKEKEDFTDFIMKKIDLLQI